MKLVIGGAYQGKLAYAKRTYGLQDGWLDGGKCAPEELRTCGGIDQFHILVRRMMEEGQWPEPFCLKADFTELEHQAELFAAWLAAENPDIVIVTNELGCGVVPMDPTERFWREAVGRICTCLAARADEVVRVSCGLGMRLK